MRQFEGRIEIKKFKNHGGDSIPFFLESENEQSARKIINDKLKNILENDRWVGYQDGVQTEKKYFSAEILAFNERI